MDPFNADVFVRILALVGGIIVVADAKHLLNT